MQWGQSLPPVLDRQHGTLRDQRQENFTPVCLHSVCQDSGLPSSLVPVKAQQEDGGTGPRDLDPEPQRERDSPQLGAEGPEDDEDSGSYQISEALTNHFYYSNGILRPKPHSNAILLQPKPQII